MYDVADIDAAEDEQNNQSTGIQNEKAESVPVMRRTKTNVVAGICTTKDEQKPQSTEVPNNGTEDRSQICTSLSKKSKSLQEWPERKVHDVADTGNANESTQTPKDSTGRRNILMILHDLEPEKAFRIASEMPVCRVIDKKWRKSLYWWIFYIWWFLHTMFGLTYNSIERSAQNVSNVDEPPSFEHVLFQDVFVTVYCFIGVFLGVVYLIMEIARMMKGSMRWTKRSFGNPYGNGWFRLCLVLMALCLIIDVFLASLVETYENYLLVCSVVIGWFLQLFFLRSWRRFSYFTVLISKIVIKDMLPFFVVLTVEVVAFSTAMHIAIQGSEIQEEEEYTNLWRVMFTMAKLMVGIGDPESFYKLRHPGLGITIFIAFVIMTTILILNALIAVMGETCSNLLGTSDVRKPHANHWILQRLSLILFIESFLPDNFHYRVGKPSTVEPFDGKFRRTIKIKSKRVLWSTEEDDDGDVEENEDENKDKDQTKNKNELNRTFSVLKHHRCELDIHYM